MDYLLTLSLRYRFFTFVAIMLVVATGLWSLAHLTIDAMPDLTPIQVQVLTRSPALGPIEVEQFVTFQSKPPSPDSQESMNCAQSPAMASPPSR